MNQTAEASYRLETLAVHGGADPTDTTGALAAPIHPAAAYARHRLDEPGAYTYSRRGNPTRDALERQLAALHGARRCVAFGSGMAAVSAVGQLLKTGDHVLLPDDVYGNTHRLYTLILPSLGIEARGSPVFARNVCTKPSSTATTTCASACAPRPSCSGATTWRA